ncbi:hypothetical protein DFH27DRAFT_577533 [Peziza echinospora]|nr:hypothetical protein DFH27DRAFT_577533 [Peziza echinospora]
MEKSPGETTPPQQPQQTKPPTLHTPALNRFSSPRCIAERLAVDLASAGTAAALVAPFIFIIDKGIIENASGKRPLGESMKASFVEMVRRPHRFFASRPLGLIYALYCGTYLTANTIDTLSSLYAPPTSPSSDIKSVTAGSTKFLATTAINMGLCLYKDRTFARTFGTISPRPVPLPTYLLFSARDTLTIFFSFNIPPRLAPYIPADEISGMVGAVKALGWEGFRKQSVAQIVAPAVCQVFSTPLHLLGLDLYNKEKGVAGGWGGRWGRVKREWAKSAVARMGRIVPAFGFGGVVNAGMRRDLMEGVEERWINRR